MTNSVCVRPAYVHRGVVAQRAAQVARLDGQLLRARLLGLVDGRGRVLGQEGGVGVQLGVALHGVQRHVHLGAGLEALLVELHAVQAGGRRRDVVRQPVVLVSRAYVALEGRERLDLARVEGVEDHAPHVARRQHEAVGAVGRRPAEGHVAGVHDARQLVAVDVEELEVVGRGVGPAGRVLVGEGLQTGGLERRGLRVAAGVEPDLVALGRGVGPHLDAQLLDVVQHDVDRPQQADAHEVGHGHAQRPRAAALALRDHLHLVALDRLQRPGLVVQVQDADRRAHAHAAQLQVVLLPGAHLVRVGRVGVQQQVPPAGLGHQAAVHLDAHGQLAAGHVGRLRPAHLAQPQDLDARRAGPQRDPHQRLPDHLDYRLTPAGFSALN